MVTVRIGLMSIIGTESKECQQICFVIALKLYGYNLLPIITTNRHCILKPSPPEKPTIPDANAPIPDPTGRQRCSPDNPDHRRRTSEGSRDRGSMAPQNLIYLNADFHMY
jgi:hypothetical protein